MEDVQENFRVDDAPAPEKFDDLKHAYEAMKQEVDQMTPMELSLAIGVIKEELTTLEKEIEDMNGLGDGLLHCVLPVLCDLVFR